VIHDIAAEPRRHSTTQTAACAVLWLGLVLTGCGGSAAPEAEPAPASQIEADVAYLASPALGGREPGTPGSAEAVRFLAARHAELGLAGAFAGGCTSSGPCVPAFAQAFQAFGARGTNVAAVLPGSDPSHRGTWIVIGAHFDHVGRSAQRSLDPERGFVVRPGADDNASGTAAVLELARRLARRPLPRSVLFVHFDAEELGLVGSRVFVREPPVPIDSMMVMINFDMVGRLRDRLLTVDLGANGQAYRGVLDSLATAQGLSLRFLSSLSDRSDHGPFDQAMVPAFALFTGFHADYHTANDIPARVDPAGILRIVDLVERLVRATGPRL